jgi:hypothetical protein
MAQGRADVAKERLLNAIAREKGWGAEAKWLEALERDAHVALEDVSTVPAYADFVAFKEGKAFVKRWRAAHAKAAK